jgi:hypothetical protein
MCDPMIESLIKPPRQIFVGYQGDTRKLIPTGDASRDKVLAERFSPKPERDGLR